LKQQATRRKPIIFTKPNAPTTIVSGLPKTILKNLEKNEKSS